MKTRLLYLCRYILLSDCAHSFSAFLAILLLPLLCFQQPVFAQLTQTQQLRLDSLMQAYQEAKQFSGTVLVAKNKRVLYKKVIGFADRNKLIPNKINTNFNIASMGKTFTATLIMQLIEEGKLGLQQNMHELLPEYPLKNADQITVYHLLTHTSGVGNYMMHPRFESERRQLKTLDDVMPYVVDMTPTLERVGERMDYSNSGFIILGRVIEKITSKSYAENLEERIFKPARIHHSYLHYPATFEAPGEAIPYLAFTARTYLDASTDEFPPFSDGGMQSNAPDLHRFAWALLSNKLLTPAWRDTMWAGKVNIGPRQNIQYGFGWMENANEFGKHIYSHDGGGKGFSSDLRIVKEDGYIIVVLINNHVYPRQVSEDILQILYNRPVKMPEKFLENILMEKVETSGFDYLVANYKQILQDYGFDRTPNPWVYAQFADMFGALKDFEKAQEVCEMGRSEFPEAAILYNVTGKLFMDQSQNEEAVNWFYKALEIDPKDGFAKMMLEQILAKR